VEAGLEGAREEGGRGLEGGSRPGDQPKEEEGEEKRKERKKRRKEKGEKGRKEKKTRNRKRKRNRKTGKEIGKSFRKIRRISQEIRRRVFAGFSGFSGVDVIFGTAVMARRTGRRDRGGAGFPSWWPTAALGRHAWVMARVRAVPAGFATRAPRGKESTGVLKRGK
jgi:hypothetical protein